MLPDISDIEARAAGAAGISLHDAIRAAYQGRVRQEDLAAVLEVDQGTVSRWSSGKSRPNIVQMRVIERMAGRPLGWIDAQCGLIDDVTTVPQAISIDPALPEEARPGLLAAYYHVADPSLGFDASSVPADDAVDHP